MKTKITVIEALVDFIHLQPNLPNHSEKKFKELSKSVQNNYIEYNKNDIKKQNIIEKSKIKEDVSKSNNIIMNHIDTKANLLNFVKYKKKAKKTLIIPSVRDISSNFTKI